ncbi:Flp pilus assembly protein RcpC/CpaB [Paraburkholderia tropica]|uniref:Flp pilus assembly protein CpaB n=1 Tax=Paraburkholderia tropica TaxID=92647 RepID=UPI001CAC2C2E|nr:Flp pilus assembly protein CpaB [Paraburkholderia tropica]CAG9195310.1 Flp pilus assembly protein RcpC/CpaB [Paraburkholderia tropica]
MANLTKIAAGLLIAAALLLGLFAFMLARRAPPAPVAPTQPAASVTQPLTPVVVAARTLPAGQLIPADALRVQPLRTQPAGSASDVQVIAGRVPLADIAADTPVLETQLSSSLASSLAAGERAVALRVDENNAVGNQLHAGNYVDVFFTLRRDGASGGTGSAEIDRTQARLLISKARVLVFGNPADSANGGAGGTQRTNGFGTQNATPRTAVLAVPLTEVNELALAQSQGQLILALRNPTDNDALDPNAFGPQPGVLRVVAHGTPDNSTRAAAGVALDQLAGAQASRQAAPVAHRAGAGGSARASGGGLEVIRGGRAETVAW